MTALILAGGIVGTSSPAQAALTAPDAAGTPAAGSTALTIRLATTEQVRAMAAQGGRQVITFRSPAAKGANASGAVAPMAVTCDLAIGLPYGGGAPGAHIYVDGVTWCDDYVHAGVLTVELFRGAERVANRTAVGSYVSVLYATAEYGTCVPGEYIGLVGATLSRYDLTPPTISASRLGFPASINCGPPPPPPTGPLVVATPVNRRTLEGNAEAQQMTATGGTKPYTWSATGLPTGMSINSSTGLISGTATRAGGFAVTVTVRDAANRTASTQFTWAVVRDGCPHC